MSQIIDARLRAPGDVIELEPFGVTAAIERTRPVLLFREKGGEAVLPVWMSPLDAGIALTQHDSQAVAMSPHDLTLSALAMLGVRAETCHFTELKGHHQYVEIRFTGSRKLKNLRSRADHAISFCLQARVKFFCTRGYLDRCRVVEAEIERSKVAVKTKRDGDRKTQYLN